MDYLLNIGLSNAVAATLLSLVAVAAGVFCRRPALVHGLWLLVLLKLVTPPLVRIPVDWPSATESTPLRSAIEDESPPQTIQLVEEDPIPLPTEEPAALVVLPVESGVEHPNLPPAAPTDSPLWPRILPVVWLAGSLGWFALALGRLHRFRRLLRHARPAPNTLQERARRLAGRLELSRCPQVGLLPGRLAPMLWGVAGSPRLFVPSNLLDRLGHEQLDTILVHELAHLRRRDHWVRALEFAVMGLYWWHPVVWYARRELREAEEQCCDAWVVSTLPGAGRTYASALMDTLDFLSSAPPAVPLLASGLGQVSDLKRRLTMILRGTTPRGLSWPGCLIVLAVGAFFLPMLPALHAQAPRREGAKRETVEIEIGSDREKQKAQLDAAIADLAAAEAALQQKKAQLERARANLHAVTAEKVLGRLTRVQVERRDQAKVESDRAIVARFHVTRVGEGKKSPSIRIEIIAGPEVRHEDLKDLLKKLEDLSKSLGGVPEGKSRIIIHPTTELPKNIPMNVRFRVIERGSSNGQNTPPLPSVTPGTTKSLGHVTFTTPANKAPEKRINDLEEKLEKVLRELHDLRQEMKRPRPEPRSETPPAARIPGNYLKRTLTGAATPPAVDPVPSTPPTPAPPRP